MYFIDEIARNKAIARANAGGGNQNVAPVQKVGNAVQQQQNVQPQNWVAYPTQQLPQQPVVERMEVAAQENRNLEAQVDQRLNEIRNGNEVRNNLIHTHSVSI